MAADVRAVITIRELIGVVVVEVIEKQRREKMKKLAILSPLVLLATTALAQDSTCILQPSCSQLGYTSAEADCGTAKVLRCPFDVSQVACLSGGSDGGSGGGAGGDGGDNYNPNDPNNEFEDAIILELKITDDNLNKVSADFEFGGGNIVVDCGDGEIIRDGYMGEGTKLVSCGYMGVGKYIFKASGTFTHFIGHKSSLSDSKGLKNIVSGILKLDKSGIKKMSNIVDSNTYGFIPPLPSSLIDGYEMFFYGRNLTGSIPELPPGLINGESMFGNCDKLTGKIPVLPSSLTNGDHMFYSTYRLSGQIPALPSGLTHADYMFGLLYDIDSTVPLLPESLVSAEKMFLNNDGLKGVAQDFSTLPNLTTYTDMFSGTGITQADNPTWPAAAW